MTEPMELQTEVVEREPETRALSLAGGAAFALARLTDEEFEEGMRLQKVGRERLQKVMRNMMTKGIHYDALPGGRAQVLLQPGAQVLRQMFRLVAVPYTTVEYGDGKTTPHITARTRCEIRMDTADGPIVAVSEGACNSWETKYRYRQAQRLCPECGKPAILKSKYPGKRPPFVGKSGLWYCNAKKDGCGAEFAPNDPRIMDQALGQMENPDPYEQLNTYVAMSEKRASNRGTIAATGSADLLTHDVPERSDDPPPPDPVDAAIDAAIGSLRQNVDAAVMAARARYTAVIRRGINIGRYDSVLQAKSPEGDAARQSTLAGHLGIPGETFRSTELGAESWDIATAAAEREIA